MPRVPRSSEDTTLSRQPTTPVTPVTRKDRRKAEREERRLKEQQQAKKPGWQSPAALLTIAAVLVGAVLIGVVFLTQKPTGAGSAVLTTPAEVPPSSLPQDGMMLGDANAPVELDIWSDYQCPACDYFATQTEPLLWDPYVATGKLKMVYKDAAYQGQKSSNPYDESVEAAAAARCAGQQGQYWQYSAWLFANQSGENLGGFTAAKMQAIADQLGLDRTKFDACVASGTEQAAVKASTQDAVAKGINTTPTLFLNGTKYVGAMPYSQLAPLIDADYAAATGSPSPSASPSGGASGASPSP
jgi:protein-disulfide isomerase